MVHLCMHVCVCVRVYCEGHRSALGVFSITFWLTFETKSLNEPGAHGFCKTNWPASTKDPQCWDQKQVHPSRLFIPGLGIPIQIFTLASQVLYQLQPLGPTSLAFLLFCFPWSGDNPLTSSSGRTIKTVSIFFYTSIWASCVRKPVDILIHARDGPARHCAASSQSFPLLLLFPFMSFFLKLPCDSMGFMVPFS